MITTRLAMGRPTPAGLVRLLTVLALPISLLLSAPVQAQEAIPLAISSGACDFTVHAADGEELRLILGSLAAHDRSVAVKIDIEPSAGREHLPAFRASTDAGKLTQLRRDAEMQQHARRLRRSAPSVPSGQPAATRLFHLLLRDGNLEDPTHYVALTGKLQGVGKTCQVYVDASENSDRAPTVAAVIDAFDQEVRPWADAHLGHVRDVDRDGRFTILISPRLSKLRTATTALDGFVRGSDFYLDLGSPFSNHADMLYLNSQLTPGPYLRTLLAHEYTHAVVFSEHALETYLPGEPARDEEGWLSEGLAHVVESIHGQSWRNLDYRVSAFLNAPERYPLTVADYYQAGLWRTPGPRGAAFLFLRWCYDRFGPDVLTRLVQSNLHGIRNLEVATQQPFEELFRAWSVSLLQSGPSVAKDGKLGDRLCPGPALHPLALGGDHASFRVAGSALLFLNLHATTAGYSRVRIHTDSDVPSQATLVRVAPNRPQLRLACEEVVGGGVRLKLSARGAIVQPVATSWELADGGREDPAELDTEGRWLGKTTLAPGIVRVSPVLHLPPGARSVPLVFKATARDDAGNLIYTTIRRP